MADDESMNNNERASQFAVAVGMLLFASVIFGSGVLGDAGEDRLSDGNDRGDDINSNAASDREEENNRLRNDRMDGDISEDMASLEIACDDGEGDMEACEEMRGMMLETESGLMTLTCEKWTSDAVKKTEICEVRYRCKFPLKSESKWQKCGVTTMYTQHSGRI